MGKRNKFYRTPLNMDRVSVHHALLLIFMMVRNDEGQSSQLHMYLFFCVNSEWHISAHIITRIMCYLYSLR